MPLRVFTITVRLSDRQCRVIAFEWIVTVLQNLLCLQVLKSWVSPCRPRMVVLGWRTTFRNRVRGAIMLLLQLVGGPPYMKPAPRRLEKQFLGPSFRVLMLHLWQFLVGPDDGENF